MRRMKSEYTVTPSQQEDQGGEKVPRPECQGCPYGRTHEFCFPCMKYILGQGGYH